MNKLCVIVTFYHRLSFAGALLLALSVVLAGLSEGTAYGQDDKKDAGDAASKKGAPEVTYPRAVALDDDALLVVDLDLPGIWRVEGDKRELYVEGTNLLRKPMNRPWCVIANPAGGILVGDSATREIYAFESAGAKGKPLNNGYVGIPMAIALDSEGKTIYVGDAEKRAVFSLPVDGGKPEFGGTRQCARLVI